MKQQENNTDLLQDETLSQKLIKKGFWLYLFSYLIAPGGYLIRLLISNSPEISVADVGILYSIISLISFLNVYNDLGLTESLQYFLPRFWIKKEYNHIKTTIWLSLGAQVLSSIIIILWLRFWSDRLAIHYFQHANASIILKHFCWYFLGINLFQSLQTIFMAFQKTFDYQFVDFVRTRGIVWFTFFCFLSGNSNIEQYSLSWIFWLSLGIICALIIYYKNYHKHLMQGKFQWHKPMLKEYGSYALWAFIGVNVANFFGQIIQQMVIFFLGPESAWYYANFLSLYAIGNILIGPIMWIIFPIVSELITKKDEKKIWLLFSFFYSYFSIFSLFIGAIFLGLGSELWIALFWERFRISWELLSYSSFFFLFTTLSSFNFWVMWGIGAIKSRVIIVLSATVLTALTTFALILSFWIYGAVFALWCSYIFLWTLSLYELKKTIHFNIFWEFIVKNSIFIVIFTSLLLLSKHLLFINYWLSRRIILWKSFVIITIFCILLLILNRRSFQTFRNELKNIHH